MTAVLALSIGSKVDHYGALAGVAAILGIGVLAILYAAQAREVKRLREWAGRAPERDADLQQRVVEDAQRRAVVPPPVAAQPVVRTQPATPAGLPTATAAVPPAMKLPGPATPAAAPGVAAAAAVAATAGTPAAPNHAAPPPVPGTPVTSPPAVAVGAAAAVTPGGTPAPAAATPALATPPVTTSPPSPAAPAAPATPAGAAQPTMVVRPQTAVPQPRAESAAAPLRTTAREAAASAPHEHGRRNLAVVLLGGVAIAAIAVLLITQVFKGSDSSTPAKPNRVVAPGQTATQTDAAGGGLPPIDRTQTRVSVLNGTSVQGLARGASTKLTERGYTEGRVKTSLAPAPTTVVYYARGSNRQGRDVARILGLDVAVVKPIAPALQAEGEGAPVVVVVGLDKAQ